MRRRGLPVTFPPMSEPPPHARRADGTPPRPRRPDTSPPRTGERRARTRRGE